MKPRVWMVLLLVGCVSLAAQPAAWGGDGATREECVAKCKAAAEMIKKDGMEATVAKMNDRGGPFVWKDSYVFCLGDENAELWGHPYFPPRALQRPMKEWRDQTGEQPFKKILDAANLKNEGWVTYMARKPGTQESFQKTSYFLRVPEAKVIVGAGIFE